MPSDPRTPGLSLVSISAITLRTLIWVSFLLTALTTPSISQERRRPTAEDLRILVSGWKQLTAAGQILHMNSHVILLFDEGDIKTIEDAKKIGDDKDTYTELIRKNRAAAIPEPTEVRLLDTFQVICFAFRTLQIPCSDVPTTLEELYGAASIRVENVTSADSKKRQDGLVEMFTKHDLSRFVADAYAFVRVVSGKQSGTKGWVRMTELRRLSPKSRP